jgi:hypothetical protein
LDRASNPNLIEPSSSKKPGKRTVKWSVAPTRSEKSAQFATGAILFRPWFLLYLGEAYGTAGRFKEALDAVAEGIAITERTGERHIEAELHRFKGELMLGGSGVKPSPDVEMEAEECFRKAIEIARQQEARSFELKAVISLSPTVEAAWQECRSTAEARRDLRMVQRRLRHGEFEGGQSAFGRVVVTPRDSSLAAQAGALLPSNRRKE